MVSLAKPWLDGLRCAYRDQQERLSQLCSIPNDHGQNVDYEKDHTSHQGDQRVLWTKCLRRQERSLDRIPTAYLLVDLLTAQAKHKRDCS